ncbi:MAG TPA: hypothetical protein VII44_08760 [Puia sp.]
MKKTGIVLFAMLFCAVSMATAQLVNSKWKGYVNADEKIRVIWIFDKDTVQVFSLPDSSLMEAMTYKVEPGFLFITRVSGMSNCDNNTVGKYQYRINNDSLYLAPVEDACSQRANAAWNEPYVRVK